MHENEKEYGLKQTLEWWNYEILSKTWKLHYLLRKQKRDHPDYITKVKGWKIFGKQATFHHVIFILVHTIISSKIWDSGTFSTYSWIWGRLQLFPTGDVFFCTYRNSLLPKCYSFAQPSGQTPLLQTPSSHHEPPTVPTRNTNGGSCSRSVLVYKSNSYLCLCSMCV